MDDFASVALAGSYSVSADQPWAGKGHRISANRHTSSSLLFLEATFISD